ncbi:XRE family transcriptional regulator [Actinoalloteichus sp. AHMU CJ021]|uniref:helix-turn-helix domain-containing protein n=1 Tax=Actinoalloteichus sp. AHMU CJ021 TaxID=2072503 RepID=UPI000CA005F2|nr:XRE family transcriptional regulator [Actinoalloteichus sp. AHMU CJ021]
MPRVDRVVNRAVADIGEYIRTQRNNAQISLRQLARAAGVSNPYLSQIERGLRRPSAEILSQIAKGLRISAETLYVQAGILDRPRGGPVVDAIHADPDLTEQQKQALLAVYESFRVGAEQAAEDPDDSAVGRSVDLSGAGAGEAPPVSSEIRPHDKE